MELIKIENSNGINVVSSRIIAKELGKEHKRILQDIREKGMHEFVQWFIPNKYKALNNQFYDEFLLTKDGFTMLVFNYQGHLEFKKAYIDKFNEMEKALQTPKTYLEALKQLVISEEARIEAERKNAVLMHVNKLYTSSEIAKELNMKSATQLNKTLNELKIQYKVNGTWVLYSKYSNLGYESIKQNVLDSGKVIFDRKWTQEGRDFILNLLGDK